MMGPFPSQLQILRNGERGNEVMMMISQAEALEGRRK